MNAKWYYALIPACISFGPFLMSNMGGLESGGWVIPMMGTVMVTAGLHVMSSMIFQQQRLIEQFTNQNRELKTTNT